MKLIELINAYENLNGLSDLILPAKESFKVVKILMDIEPQVLNYNTQRNKLLAKYGDTKDDKNYKIREAEQENFKDELLELQNIEIDLKFEKIKIPDEINIKPANIINILDFIEITERTKGEVKEEDKTE